MEQVIKQPETLTNSRGFQVPRTEISPQDLLKDEMVLKFVAQAEELSHAHEAFKREVFSQAHDLIALIAEDYGVKVGGTKGNVTLSSYDNKSKIQIGIDEQISFGPEIDVAKQLITEVIESELEETSTFIAKIMRDAFETDKEGQYNKTRIMTLRKYRDLNKSDEWANAMRALDDAIIAGSSKTYLTFHRRNQFGKWVQIPLVSKSL